jgi:hypothetical protein
MGYQMYPVCSLRTALKGNVFDETQVDVGVCEKKRKKCSEFKPTCHHFFRSNMRVPLAIE